MRLDSTARRQDSNVFVLDKLANVLDPLTEKARECLRQQAAAIAKLSIDLDETFAQAIRLLFAVEGHVVVTGIGKSGLVGRKIAATFASTGTPSFFVHAGEALHGDLGMITERDAVILISHSGETHEVTALLPHLKRRGIKTLALVGNEDSSLGAATDVVVEVAVDREVCPNNLAPTSSTLATLAMGHTLAVALMSLRGFHREDFAKLHPAGSLGQRLRCVGDAYVREGVPILSPSASAAEGLLALAESQVPMALVCDGATLLGVLTSSDLRGKGQVGLLATVGDVMNRTPPTITANVPLPEAERRLDREKLPALVVVEENGEVLGVFVRRTTVSGA